MAITDKIMKASNGTRPNPTTLSAQKGIGDAILTADDLTGWATDTPVTFTLFKVDTSGKEIIDTRTDWKGIVSGNTITQLTLTAGVDDIYPSGSPVIATATARWADDLATAVLVSLAQNGTLKDSVVTTTKLADLSVTGDKIANYRIPTQADTANVTQTTATIQAGWGQILGNNTGIISETLTFPTPVTTVLSFVVTLVGYKSGGAAATSITQFNTNLDSPITIDAHGISGTGATIKISNYTGVLGGSYHGYSWILVAV